MPDERTVALPKELQSGVPSDSEIWDDMRPMLNLIEQEELLHNESWSARQRQ